MKIDWINKEDSNGAVTLYDNNITLSKKAANFFMDAYAVAVGIDRDTQNIIIKSVSKEEANQLDKDNLHKIAIKNSYGRITGKRLINEISGAIKIDFSKKQAYKYGARWNTGYKMLIVNTKEVF